MRNAITKQVGPMGGLPSLRQMNSLFNELVNGFWDDNTWDTRIFEDIQPKASLPKLNVSETDEKYEIEISVAGFSKDDIELELKDNTLFIKCEHNEEKEDSDKTYLMKEISKRSFRRVLRFPKKIDAETISCKYEDGIVHCDIAKKDVKKIEDGVKILIN